MSQTQALEEFRKNRYVEAGGARVCYHKAGEGPPLVLFHGYPLSGLTWRKLIPALSKHFTCYAFDLVGLGGTTSTDNTDHTSPGQGRVFQRALGALGVPPYALAGNDSGGWVARELALIEPPGRVTRLLLTNTEIPNHRPPTVWFYQRLARVPGSSYIFQGMLATRLWRKSEVGFGGCFHDPDLVDGEFFREFLAPLLDSRERMLRALRFLILMRLSRVDDFAELHKKLTMPTAFVWGSEDPTFPEGDAREMATQFPNVVSFTSIPKAKLFLHEEFPDEVLEPALEFLLGGKAEKTASRVA